MTQSQDCSTEITDPEELEELIYAMTIQEVTSPKAYESIVASSCGDEKAYSRLKRCLMCRAEELGREVLKHAKRNFKEWEKEDAVRAKQQGVAKDNYIDFADLPDWVLPYKSGNWICQGNTVTNRDGEIVTTTPVFPLRIINTDAGDCEKVELVYKPRGEDQWQRKFVKRSTLSTSKGVTTLAIYGIDVTDATAKQLVSYLREVIALNALPRETEITHCGWQNGKFFPHECDSFVVSDDTNSNHIANFTKQAGTLKEWLNYIVPYLKTYPQFYEYFCASLAAPLLTLVGSQTFVAHLWGKTSFGKTLCLRACSTTWGSPRLVKSLNSTTNSLMAYLGACRNLPFFADEFQSISGYVKQSKLVYDICMEVGRSRLNANSEQQITDEWRTVVLTTGESQILTDTDQAGAAARMLDIHCEDIIFGKMIGQSAADFFDTHYGTFAPVYIKLLKSKSSEKLHEDYRMCKKYIMDASPDIQAKQCSIAAAIMQASLYFTEIANDDEFIKSEDGKMLKFVQEANGGFRAYNPATDTALKSSDYVISAIMPEAQAANLKSTEEVEMPQRAYDYVVSYVAANQYKFPTEMEYCDDKRREVYGMSKYPDNTIYFNLQKLNGILGELGTTFNAVKRDWYEYGYIRKMKYGGKERFAYNLSILGVVVNGVILVLPKKKDVEEVRQSVAAPSQYGIENNELDLPV